VCVGGGVVTAPMRTWFVKHVMKSSFRRDCRQMKDTCFSEQQEKRRWRILKNKHQKS